MATAIIMPRQGQSVERCLFGDWKKAVGDTVEIGDVLFSYETDKATFEEEAKVAGTLLAVLCEPGDDITCLHTVAVIGEKGEDISSLLAENEEAAPEAPTSSVVEAVPLESREESGRVLTGGVSPRARATAERIHVDPAAAVPTGPHGRILERDVLRIPRTAIEAPATLLAGPAAAPTGYHDEPLPNIRRRIAASMQKSLSTSAQLTHQTSFDASGIVAYRRRLKNAEAILKLPTITYNDMILFAVSRVLKNHPVLNAHFLGDHIRYFDHVHLGVAVDTPRGLIVPTIFNADCKSLCEIAKESKELATAAQGGAISPDLLTGASFTISNLGTLDIEMFTPIINPPQTGILGVNCMVDRVRTVEGQVTVYPAMGLSLTYDHRALDGAPASRFLKELKTAMEQFTEMLAQ